MTNEGMVLRDQADPRRAGARRGHQRARTADLPDDVVHVRRHRTRGEPVRAEGTRQHLHAHHEPDPGRGRGPARGARGRHRRRCWSPAGRPPRRSSILNIAEAGDHIVSSRQPLRRHVQPVPLHAPEARHRGHVRRRPRRPRVVARGGTAQHEGVLRRDDRQPEERHPRHRGGRRRGARQRRAAHRRQHGGHAVPDPAARSGAPTSSCTRPRSTSAATARRSPA